MRSYLPVRRRVRTTALVSAGASVSVTSELLPEPDTPVTTTSAAERESRRRGPSGCSPAPRRSRIAPRPGHDDATGMGMLRSPDRYSPVSDSGAGHDLRRRARAHDPGRRARPRPGPCRRRSPPRGWSPRRARRRSRCCRGRAAAASVPISRALSRWCRPMDGSSRM